MKRALATDARIEFSALIAALEEDATALAEAFGADQSRQLGIEKPRTPLEVAMWDSDPENVTWKKAELERLRGLRFAADPLRLSDEARDLRS